MGEPVRIAMWSGPRNISTALMRSFENRADTSVSDEPFYAAYLAATGLDHPMRVEVLASQPTDPEVVAAAMTGPVPGGRPIWYQKHMTHHMLPGFGRRWIDDVVNVFLLREPRAVLASYVRKRAAVTLSDIGLPQQLALFEQVSERLGKAPLVVEGNDMLADPPAMLHDLCGHCGIPFSTAMLTWPKGPRKSDGAWAPAWYDQVELSTGFSRPLANNEGTLPADLERIVDAARPFYEALSKHRLRRDGTA